MSKENVEIVRRFVDRALETPDAVWDIFDEDVEWDLGPLATPDFPPVSRGPEGVREFFRRWAGTFEDWGYEIEEWIDTRNAVALHVHQWGRGKGSGAAVDQRFWQVWTMRNGQAVRVTHRADRAGALEAAGLSE